VSSTCLLFERDVVLFKILIFFGIGHAHRFAVLSSLTDDRLPPRRLRRRLASRTSPPPPIAECRAAAGQQQHPAEEGECDDEPLGEIVVVGRALVVDAVLLDARPREGRLAAVCVVEADRALLAARRLREGSEKVPRRFREGSGKAAQEWKTSSPPSRCRVAEPPPLIANLGESRRISASLSESQRISTNLEPRLLRTTRLAPRRDGGFKGGGRGGSAAAAAGSAAGGGRGEREGGGDDVVVGEGVRGAGSRRGERAKDVALAKDAGPRVGGAECRDLRVWVR